MRYYGIGLSRTGTTSLFTVMIRFGFKAFHNPAPQFWEQRAEYEFMNNLPVPARFEQLDSEFPGSKFIYTYREVDSWVHSCDLLVQRLLNVNPFYDWMEEYHMEMYGHPTFDEACFRAAHARHDKHVREYFADRPDDLLIMDITQGDGYDKLIPFIGMENLKFPWANSTANPRRPY